jgi:aryl-alcohol dehydrogenase-like predicted oxidoreductase
VHPLTAVQIEYSLWSRDVESEILPLLRELGIGLVAYAPLGRGFLTGRYRARQELAANDFRRTQPRFAEENLRENRRLVDRVERLAARHGVSAAQLAIAWVLHQGEDIVPLAGAKRVGHLEENCGATDVGLSAEDLAEIVNAIPEPAGERYDAASMATVGI